MTPDAWMFVALGVVAMIVTLTVVHQRDVARDRANEYRGYMLHLLSITAGQEPSRMDTNGARRDRFVFCARWTEQGHGTACPWQAVIKAMETRP